MTDPIRAAYERAFTGSNRTCATWAAFRAGWQAHGAEPEKTERCNDERDCIQAPWCRISGKCHRAVSALRASSKPGEPK